MSIFGKIWNGMKKGVSAPFKLVANVGKKIFNNVIKPVANFGKNVVKSTGNFIKSTGNFVKDSANTVLHMPEKVLHTVDHGVDKAGDTLQSLFKSPMMLLLGVGAVVILPSLMKMK